MVADVEVAVQYALGRSGEPYCANNNRWHDPTICDDCSSLAIKSYRAAGIYIPSNVTNTVGLYEWARDNGYLVSVSRGVATRGALMIKGRTWGFGPNGHASISLGNGWEMAAHGTRSGVHDDIMDVGFYQDAIILPPALVNYHIPIPVDPGTINALKKLHQWDEDCYAHAIKVGDQGPQVAICIDLFTARHFLKKGTKGDKAGRAWVVANGKFKNAVDLRVDGKPNRDANDFGGPAADALLALG